MKNTAYLPIVADRYGVLVRHVYVVGMDLTGVAMRAQVRFSGDTPGAPLVDLLTVTNGNAELICRSLPIAPSTYFEHVAQRQDPARLSARARQDVALKPEIARVFAQNFAVYGVRKVWRQMMREGFPVVRCTVERPMREMGLTGGSAAS